MEQILSKYLVTYSAVFYNILIIYDDVSGALEIFQSLGGGIIHLLQIGYQQC